MNGVFLFLVCVATSTAALFADSFNSNPSLACFEQDRHGIIDNVVDTVSGCYLEQEIDCSIQTSTSTPLTLQHSYSSNTGDFRFFSYCMLVAGIQKEKTHDVLIAYTSEPNGSSIVYSGYQNDMDEENELRINLPVHAKGFVNSAKGEQAISAQSNFKNNLLKIKDRGSRCHIVTCNGSERFYEKIAEQEFGPFLQDSTHRAFLLKLKNPSTYLLTKEILPNGNKIFYRYSEAKELQKVELVNNHENKVLSSISFLYSDAKIEATASDTQTCVYEFDAKKQLVRVKRSQKPHLKYSYKKFGNKQLISKKESVAGPLLSLEYTDGGKVTTLFCAGSEEARFAFKYKDGQTDVVDQLGNKSRFEHCDQKLVAILRYMKDAENFYSREKFTWAGIIQEGELLSRQIEDEKGQVVLLQKYHYDEKGNVLYDVISGQEITFESVSKKVKNSFQSPQCTFSEDQFHTLEKEESPSHTTLYTYKKGTNLIASKLICCNQLICKRHFYFYNEDAVLIKEIMDDGNLTNSNFLALATERQIREIQPQVAVGTGTEIIEEKYYDFSQKVEKLKKRIQNERDSQGNLTKRLVYDSQGELFSTEEFSFDAHRNLMRSVNPLGEATLYTYDESDRLLRKEEKAKRLVTTFQYDAQGNLLSVKEKYREGGTKVRIASYDAMGRKTASIDHLGNSCSYVYDALSRLTSICEPRIQMNDTEKANPIWLFSYDVLGRMISKKDPNGHEEMTQYTVKGDPVSIQFPDKTQEQFEWAYKMDKGEPEKALLLRKKERNNTFNSYEYDYQGRLIRKEHFNKQNNSYFAYKRFEYSTFHLQRVRSEENYFTLFSYDAAGRLILEIQPSVKESIQIDPQSKRTDYEYDTLGRVSLTKKWVDEKTYLVEMQKYDLADRVVERWFEESQNEQKEKLLHEKYTYDPFGNLVKRACGDVTEEISFLQGSKPQLIRDKDGKELKIEYDESQITTTGEHYLEKQISYPNGNTVLSVYDPLGREVEVLTKDEQGTHLKQKKQHFDAVGNLLEIVETILPKQEKSADEIKTKMTYGPKNSLQSKMCGELSAQYTYNHCGELKSINFGQETHQYEYSSTGHLLKIRRMMEKALPQTILNFDSDKLGRIVAACSPEGIKTYRSYTHLGQLAEETIEDEYGKYSVSYEYDRLGRVKRVVLPDNSCIEYSYKGPLSLLIVRKLKTGKEEYRHHFKRFSAQGFSVCEQTLRNGGDTNMNVSGSGALTASDSYFYKGRIKKKDKLGNPLEVIVGNESTQYVYDAIGRLVEEKGPTPSSRHTYLFDSLLRLREKDDMNYFYNSTGQLIEGKKENVRAIFFYDERGNCKEQDGAKLIYNPLNMLTSFEKEGSDSVFYKWDSLRRCANRKQVGQEDKVLRFFYIGGEESGAINERSSVVELKVPRQIKDEVAEGCVAIEIYHRIYLPIFDLFGNVIYLANASHKKILESYSYSAFGEEMIFDENGTAVAQSVLGNPWRYRARRKDQVTGFLSYGDLEYDPITCRFLNSSW